MMMKALMGLLLGANMNVQANPFPRRPLTPDEEHRVATRIGFADGNHRDDFKCLGCHPEFEDPVTLQRIARTTFETRACFDAGLGTPAAAQQVIGCLSKRGGGNDLLTLRTQDLGFMAAAIDHKAFRELFQLSGREADYKAFKAKVAMPLGDKSFEDEDLELVLSWILGKL